MSHIRGTDYEVVNRSEMAKDLWFQRRTFVCAFGCINNESLATHCTKIFIYVTNIK